MAFSNERHRQAVLETAERREDGTHDWWTALSFDDGDLALEPDPVLTTDRKVDELELRLYSL